MSTVTLDIRPLEDTLQDFAVAWKNGKPSEPRISFETPELLWQVLTAKRWEILKIMAGIQEDWQYVKLLAESSEMSKPSTAIFTPCYMLEY